MTGAGFDPAFIPGISVPAPAKSEEVADAQPEPPESVESAPSAKAAARPEDSAAPEETDETDETDEATDGEGPDDGPVFEASDRRAKIVADRKGVRLRLDEESCEFRWEEIAAVETESPRFGKRYTITVHTPDRRWYPIEIEAAARARFQEWDAQLDAVLDAYFEDGSD
ncbi:hypothetical protein M878_15545 [Streptomyces roseochromogenus subsp. oscitans DS 12.976]|uniref:Uncharacterized protein n=1 Tax=Streptomyces roseochromogenus subsp. oscitans DS 12.976 TaxID=1352936 RepID=V6KJI6_STRRC|nr:hypothetical protein M878_15545 [Streptomyces roseochromogenus subsp. oscitans DS 12.976]